MMFRRLAFSVPTLVAAAVFAAGCGSYDQAGGPSAPEDSGQKMVSQRQAAVRASAPKPASDLGDYRIGPGDVLSISVWKNEDLSRTVPVRPDGMISLPLLNEVQAAGLTPTQLRGVLVKRLSTYTGNPEVSVTVQEVRSFVVSVLGEVRTPGRYELRSQATVLDAVAVAGGLSEFASRGRILILRKNKDGVTKRIAFDYNKALAAGGADQNMSVEPGDIVVVP